ncbi:MAG: aspartate aminotransferase family protein [Phycisphaerae bacterium]
MKSEMMVPEQQADALQHSLPVGDIDPAEFRAAMHRVADMVADYLENVGEYSVSPDMQPGDLRAALPKAPPLHGQPLDTLLDDYKRLIEPNVTHWNHPGFMAYFAVTGSAPGILGEALCAALNVNAMLWRTGPAPTELEEHVCDWLRQMMDLPKEFRGHINDTASISSMLALAAARERAGFDIRTKGMAGRADLPQLTIYCSDQAHSSIDKAALTLGLGVESCRRVASNDAFELDIDALERKIAEDKQAGCMPIAIVATIGTTSTTAVDPVAALADIAQREGMWLHVDGAYAGSAAICPEYRAKYKGLERADSFVFNPHKWLFVPVDCSILMVRDEPLLKRTFSIIPAYLTSEEQGVTNLMDLGVQLGRRFRALKVWMVLRGFGQEGLQARIRNHCRLAQEFASWVDASQNFERVAPVPFSTVNFVAKMPVGSKHAGKDWREVYSQSEQDAYQAKLEDAVNAAGPVFISHTKLKDRYCLRLSVGNLRTTRETLKTTWNLLRINQESLEL